MPIFEYECRVCGSRFEKLCINSEKISCLCGGPVDKIPSTCNFDLVGGGFYRNDYKLKAELRQRRQENEAKRDAEIHKEIQQELSVA